MPIVKIYGGLGNQLFQYAFAHQAADKTKEEIILDVSFYKKRKWPDYQLDKLNIPAAKKVCYPERNKIQRGISKIWRHIRYIGWSFFKEEDTFSSYYPNIEKPKTYYDGYFGNVNYFREYREDLIKMFTPKAEIGGSYGALLEQIKNSNSVAIHYRRGDYIPLGWAISNSYYKTAVTELLKQHKDLRLFIFSNDIDYAVQQMKEIDASLDVVPVCLEEGDMRDLAEFTLMKHCKHFVIANSTYSWWAAYLANRDDCVFAPKVNQWGERAYPQEWKLIDAEIQK